MSRIFAVAFSIVFALGVSTSAVRAQNNGSEANKLFVEAVKLYRQSEEMTGNAKLEAYEQVRSLFDQILNDYPKSKPAKVISQGGSPGGVTIASLPSSKPKGWNDGKRGIVRDLLVNYDNDIGAIEAVAEAAVYAHLAWAAYGAAEPKQYLEQRGWKLLEAYKGDRALVGDVTASLYEGPQGQHVLTFRGSVTGGDWVTNVGGTLSPTPLLNGQVVDALNLADKIVQKFPDLVFVGHSLGGRLAQASSLKTGNLAFAFNSAPVGYNEIRQMGFQDLIRGKMRRFRSPQDQLSGVFTPSDTIVANIELVDANALLNLVNAKDYTHAMNVLAEAMEAVSVAWKAGWVAAYLDEQNAIEPPIKEVQVAGQSCAVSSQAVSRNALLEWSSKSIIGRTASGADWSLNPWNLTTNEVGPAVFTNSKGEKSTGLWRPLEGQICQSYNKGASWACHGVFSCENAPESRFVMKNADGDFSSIVTISEKVRTLVVEASPEPKTPARNPDGIRDADYSLRKTKRVPISGKNCFIHAPWDKPTSASWDGRCEDGKLVGEGTIGWRDSSGVIWKSRVGEKWGLVVRNGDLFVSYPTSEFDISIHRCGKRDYERLAVAKAPSGTDVRLLQNDWLSYFILEETAKYLMNRCRYNGQVTFSNIRVKITVGPIADIRYDHKVEGRAYDDRFERKNAPKDRVIWKSVSNATIRDLRKEIERDNAAERDAKRAEERRQAQLRAQRQAELRRQEEARRQQAAREAAAKRQAELAALQRQIEQQWASRMEDMFTGQYVIKNVGDLLQYNKAKAISLLSQGVTLQLATQNMSFQDGTVIIAHEHDPTDVLKPVRDAARAQMDTLTAWMDTTSNVGRDYSGPSINVVCRLSASALEQLDGKTTARFDATMQTLNGRSAVFDCKLKR